MNTKRSTALLNCSAVLALTAAGVIPQAAMAQDDEIMVTGSRVARSTFSSPTPITVVDSQQIENLGQINISETIRSLPQNVASISGANIGISGPTTRGSEPGAEVANLRGLNPNNGSVRTLALVNTRRFVPTSTGGQVDLNLIPSMLVDRVETVTGGASAQYGTDALAGVVNILLDNTLQGVKGQADYGRTFRGDGDTWHVSFGAGSEFADGRGHIILGVEWEDQTAIGDCTDVRQWCTESWDIITNPGFATPGAPGYGDPQYLLLPNVAYTNYTETTVLRGTVATAAFAFGNPDSVRNLRFNEAGDAVLDFDPGQYLEGTGFGNRFGGDCLPECSVWSETQMRPELERLSIYSRVQYDLTDAVRAFAEVSYGERDNSASGLSLGPASRNYITKENPFLPAELVALIPDNYDFVPPSASKDALVAGTAFGKTIPGLPVQIRLAKHFKNVPGARNHVDTSLSVWRFVGGLEGEVFNGWNWDAFYSYGKTQRDTLVSGIRLNTGFQFALDAVEDPVTGDPVCRLVLLGDPDAAGCVPLNIFGIGNESQAALDYAYKSAPEAFEYEQQVLGANLTGDLFNGFGAGPVGVAVGGEYRFEEGSTKHFEDSLPYLFDLSQRPFSLDYAGELKILEGYVEARVPLLRDLPFAKNLEFDGAYRITHQENNSSTGESKEFDVDTWKVTGIWDITNWLRVRGTRSKDIRAASFRDLYDNQGLTPPGPPTGVTVNPWTGGLGEDTEIFSGGNFALEPEEGDTTTLGVVLQPGGFLSGLQLSADWYEIDITNAIGTLTTAQVVDVCFRLGAGCGNIQGVGNPTTGFTDITRVTSGAANIGGFLQHGWDLEANYRFDIDRILEGAPGEVNIRSVATYVYDMIVELGTEAAGTPLDNYAGQSGGGGLANFTPGPEWQNTTWITYLAGPFTSTLEIKRVGEGIYDIRRTPVWLADSTTPNTINTCNCIDEQYYFSLSASYDLLADSEETLELFATINNIFDNDPPPSPNGGGNRVPGNGHMTNPVYYDVYGARFRLGARFRY